ncbi:MAG: hypothetical protein M3277_07460 [Actinomycetota bacterium]|nr:hypothetical protein [Actinomycetota bacterium]
MTKVSITAAALVLAAASIAVPATASETSRSKAASYEPPYKDGPSGGDNWNHVERDADSGRMAITRVFPGFPPVVGCVPEPSAGWGMFEVAHKLDRPVSKVTLEYEAAIDAYSWITVGARNEDRKWLGVAKLQGPIAGSGKLAADLFASPSHGKITLEFGLQLGDACPQIGFAAASFPSVAVR